MTRGIEATLSVLLAGLAGSACSLIDAAAGEGDQGGATGAGGSGAACVEDGPAQICFGEAVAYHALVSEPRHLAVADFDGDGHLDVCVAGRQLACLKSQRSEGGWRLEPGPVFSDTNDVVDVAVGDFDGSGAADLAFADAVGNRVGVVLDALGSYQQRTITASSVRELATIELEGTGADDLLALQQDRRILPVLIDEQGTLTAGESFAIETMGDGSDAAPTHLVVGRFVAADEPPAFAYASQDQVYVYRRSNSSGAAALFERVDSTWPGLLVAALAPYPVPNENRDWLGIFSACDPCDGAEILQMWNVGSKVEGTLRLTQDGPFMTSGAAFGRFVTRQGEDGLVAVSENPASRHAALLFSHWELDAPAGPLPLPMGAPLPAAVATGDLNDDGIDDVVLASPSTDEIRVHLSMGMR